MTPLSAPGCRSKRAELELMRNLRTLFFGCASESELSQHRTACYDRSWLLRHATSFTLRFWVWKRYLCTALSRCAPQAVRHRSSGFS
jgi:hypothetical protein